MDRNEAQIYWNNCVYCNFEFLDSAHVMQNRYIKYIPAHVINVTETHKTYNTHVKNHGKEKHQT